MAKFIPPPRRHPVAGFASTTEAVMSMADEGKKPREIAEALGTTTETVRGMIQRARTERRTTGIDGLPADRAAELREIYRRTLVMLSESRHVEVEILHALFRGTHIKNPEPALPPEQKVDEAEPARAGIVDPANPEPPTYDATVPPRTGSADRKDAGLVAQDPDIVIPITPKPEPKPMMVMKLDKRPMDLTNASRFYTLRREGMYLNLDGSGFTDVRRHAYRATLPQARKMRLVNAVAMGCSLSPFELSKK
jgi:hypothetical protein